MKSFEFRKRAMPAKEVPTSDLKKMGLSPQSGKRVRTFEELRKSPLNIVIGECVTTIDFSQNKSRSQSLKKKAKYVMGLGVYKQLWFNPYTQNKKLQKILRPAKVKFKNIYRPYRGQDLENKTLLVTRTGGIGDLLFIQPNLIYLKEKYPSCTIKFACGPQYQAMVEGWECVDVILDLPIGFNSYIKADYHAIFEGVIERCELATTVNAYRLFTDWLELYLPDELLIPKQNVDPKLIKECEEFLGGVDKFMLFQLKASSPVRTPDPTVWKKLIEGIVGNGYTVLITDAPSSAGDIDEFMKDLDDSVKSNVFNFAHHSKTLSNTIAMASLADCCVSTDSSLIHLAASVGTPAFGLYGPFPGEVRLTTYKNVDWINAEKVCAPCFIHGHSPCYKSKNGNSPCYNNIDINDAIKRIKNLCN